MTISYTDFCMSSINYFTVETMRQLIIMCDDILDYDSYIKIRKNDVSEYEFNEYNNYIRNQKFEEIFKNMIITERAIINYLTQMQ